MNDKKLNQEEMEQTIEELQDRVKDLQAKVDFFLFPLSIHAYNKVGSQGGASVPAIMGWLVNEFYLKSDNERKRFLKNLYDELKKLLPMDLYAVKDLPEVVEEPVDLSVFEK